MQTQTTRVRVDEALVGYIQAIAEATRRSPLIELGVSTRGALALRACAQARAFSLGRDYCLPEDVKQMAVPALAHRIQIARAFESQTFAAHREDEEVLERVINETPAPV